MILNKPGDAGMPDLFAVYARGLSPDGIFIDACMIPEKDHTAVIDETLELELKNKIPEIPSVQLEIGQSILIEARFLMEWAIDSSISLEDVGFESFPNCIAMPVLEKRFSFPTLYEFARMDEYAWMDEPEIIVLNEKTICSQSLDMASLYINLRRSSLGRSVKGIGPN